MHTRREVKFLGQVQGVGFRYITDRIAKRFAVAGFVKNQPDGSVQLICEGEEDEVQAFLHAVKERMSGYIRDAEVSTTPAQGEFERFEITK